VSLQGAPACASTPQLRATLHSSAKLQNLKRQLLPNLRRKNTTPLTPRPCQPPTPTPQTTQTTPKAVPGWDPGGPGGVQRERRRRRGAAADCLCHRAARRGAVQHGWALHDC